MLKRTGYPNRLEMFRIVCFTWIAWWMLSGNAIAQVKSARSTLVVLNPAHPHGAQLQQKLKHLLHKDVYVYAPVNNDLKANYLNPIDRYNASDTTGEAWQVHTYIGDDYLQRMLRDKKGDLVIIASNNRSKAGYILKAAEAGFDVIADKPMALTSSDFDTLRAAFSEADKHDRFVSDLPVMTMRNQIIYLLQKELAAVPGIFGTLEKGSPEAPAVVQENRHYYYKGIKRPTWFFDVQQQGNGVTDVTTHLADLVLWTCFPAQTIQYEKDIKIESARIWPTMITPEQFKKATGVDGYPDFLNPYQQNGVLEVFSNGEIMTTVKGVYVRLTARWDFEPPPGGSDTYHSVLRGTRATLLVKAGQPSDLYIHPANNVSSAEFAKELSKQVDRLKKDYPAISLHQEGGGWRISTQQRTLQKEAYVTVPGQQEVDWMLAKYYLTTQADAVAKKDLLNGTRNDE